MKKLLLLFLLAFVSYSVVGEPTGPSKRCATCGQPIPKCKYKGKHPKPATQNTSDPKRKQDTDAKRKAEAEAKRKREAEAQRQREAEAQRQREAETQRQREAEAQRQREAEAQRQREAEAQRQREAEAQRQREAEAKRPKTGTINGHDWVDLGLSVKWATCNVGALSPSDYGNYYAWGDIRPKYRYTWSNCFDCLDDKGDSWGIYKIGGKTQITPSSGHDTARENWGASWRLPTIAELEELNSKCQWTWTSKNGHNGYVVVGPNGNSIFLPAAGYRLGSESGDLDAYGNYWSSDLSSGGPTFARLIYFDNSSRHISGSRRRFGQSVRPVTE